MYFYGFVNGRSDKMFLFATKFIRFFPSYIAIGSPFEIENTLNIAEFG